MSKESKSAAKEALIYLPIDYKAHAILSIEIN